MTGLVERLRRIGRRRAVDDAAPVANNIEPAAAQSEPERRADGRIAGERGIPSVNRGASVQARITRALAVGLTVTLATLASAWYVKANVDRMDRPAAEARAAAKARAAGDMPLPPLGPVSPPRVASGAPTNVPTDSVGDVGSLAAEEIDLAEDDSALSAVLGERPEAPHWSDYAPAEEPLSRGAGAGQVEGFAPAASPPLAPVDRRLEGAVFASSSGAGLSAMGSRDEAPNTSELSAQGTGPSAPALVSRDVARATRLPTRRWWLAKGSFLDCTLETAIDSTWPGLVTGVLAADVYGADGQVVLLERGTRLLGETRGSIARGQARLQILWQEARTPTGVVIALESPGTDPLGRAGVTGEVDRHFGERFGAAMLVSVLDGAVQAAIAAQRDGDGDRLVVSPSASSDIATEVLKDTIGIAPTITIAPGTRVQVLVARDVDFRGVYGLERRAAR